MSSTGFNVGYNSEAKVSSKILKPPGGGSSDIFGTQTPAPEIRQKINPQQVSSIFGPPPEIRHKVNPQQVSSIFEINSGKRVAEPQPQVTAEQPNTEAPSQNSAQVVNNTQSEALCQQGAGSRPSSAKRYDPITGEGGPQSLVQPSVRIRNPPGGKSSGIF